MAAAIVGMGTCRHIQSVVDTPLQGNGRQPDRKAAAFNFAFVQCDGSQGRKPWASCTRGRRQASEVDQRRAPALPSRMPTTTEAGELKLAAKCCSIDAQPFFGQLRLVLPAVTVGAGALGEAAAASTGVLIEIWRKRSCTSCGTREILRYKCGSRTTTAPTGNRCPEFTDDHQAFASSLILLSLTKQT